jgi:copper(I)-binding protein
MPGTRRRPPVLRTSALGVLLLAGCTTGEPLSTPGAEVTGGRAAPDERLSDDLSVTEVVLAYPQDGVYDAGDDAALTAAFANSGDEPDTLVDVRGPDFAEARDGDGGEFAIAIPEDDTLHVTEDGARTITLVDLDRSLRSSQSIPVTFEFARAGEVTIDTVVAPAP